MRQWPNFTMGPNEQNQHFAALRQKVCVYIHVVVLLRCMPSLDVTKNGKSGCQTKVRQTIEQCIFEGVVGWGMNE